jgi:TRAP-type C4-dicarboxylate transport system permease small subunit
VKRVASYAHRFGVGVYRLLAGANVALDIAAKTAVALMLAVNLSIVFAGVVFRYLLGNPLGWVYEVAVFLMMWSAFVGSASLVRSREHVALNFLVLRIAPAYRRWVQVAMELLVLAFLAVIIGTAVSMIRELSASRSAYLRIPMFWVYSSVPVGMGMVFLQLLESILRSLMSVEPENPGERR